MVISFAGSVVAFVVTINEYNMEVLACSGSVDVWFACWLSWLKSLFGVTLLYDEPWFYMVEGTQ